MVKQVWIVMIIVVALILIIGGFFLFNQWSTPSQNNQQDFINGGKVSAPINQNFDSSQKLLLVGDTFDITLTISAREDYLEENVIVGSLYNKIHSQYESPFDGKILNFEDNFEILSVSEDWQKEKISEQSNYEIVKFMAENGQSEILQEGWLYLNNQSATETKTITFSLKAKQKGRFGFVMSQMQSKTGFINLCVGDSIEEAQELCKEIKPTSTRIESE